MEESELSDPSTKLVLIVDDDESLLDLIEYVVSGQGFRVERAMDGELGLWKAMNVSPDLILLDLMLPKYGGFEIMDELRNSGAADVPMIVMTGRYTEEATSARIKGNKNVRGFLRKPVSHQALTVLIHSILNTRPPATPAS